MKSGWTLLMKIWGTSQFGAHIVDIGAHAVAAAQGFARQAVVAPQHGLGTAKIDDLVAALVPLDEAVHDIADTVLVLVELARALRLANLLHDRLFRRLGGNASEFDGRQVFGDEVPRPRRSGSCGEPPRA